MSRAADVVGVNEANKAASGRTGARSGYMSAGLEFGHSMELLNT